MHSRNFFWPAETAFVTRIQGDHDIPLHTGSRTSQAKSQRIHRPSLGEWDDKLITSESN